MELDKFNTPRLRLTLAFILVVLSLIQVFGQTFSIIDDNGVIHSVTQKEYIHNSIFDSLHSLYIAPEYQIGYVEKDTLPGYKNNMTKAEQKKLKVTAVDEWGRPTFTHETRVLIYDGPVSTVKWRRYDSEAWEEIVLIPKFTIKSKWQFSIVYDWVQRVAESHFDGRYYIARNDHDVIDAAWAAAEHFERFTKLIGVPVAIDYMLVVDSSGRQSVVRDKGKSMTKPSKFSQIETGKK